MAPAGRMRLLPLFATLALLAGAGWYAAQSAPVRREACSSASRAEVEGSFGEIRAQQAAGRPEEALLALRRRAEKGPHAAAATFLLGEAAYAEAAYGTAMSQFRKALELDASLSDRDAPFDAGRVMLARAEALRRGPWAGSRGPDVAAMQFLLRRLAGGCE